jgi:hypothetical protein
MTSGQVRKELEKILSNADTVYTSVSRDELQAVCSTFSALIDRRNALIHAHPITDSDGSQILNYQASIHRPLSDMKWSVADLREALDRFDAAACYTTELLQRLLSKRAGPAASSKL